MIVVFVDIMIVIVKVDCVDVLCVFVGCKFQQCVQDILCVGCDVFVEKGYEYVMVVEIVQCVGVLEVMVFSYFCGKCELCVCVIVDWYDEIIVVFEYGMLWEVLVQQQFVFIVCIYLWLMFVNGMGLCVLVLLEGCVKQYVLSDEFIVLQCCYMVLLMDVFVCGQVVG